MVTYDLLEDEIVQRLATLSPAIEIEALPDTPTKFSKPFVKPRITIAYRSSEYSKDPVKGLPTLYATDKPVQEEFAAVEIVIQARVLRGDRGVHAIKAAVLQLVHGFRPTNWSPLTVESYKFIDHDKDAGLFSYALTMLCFTVVVPQADAENLVTLSQVNFDIDANVGS